MARPGAFIAILGALALAGSARASEATLTDLPTDPAEHALLCAATLTAELAVVNAWDPATHPHMGEMLARYDDAGQRWLARAMALVRQAGQDQESAYRGLETNAGILRMLTGSPTQGAKIEANAETCAAE